MKSSTPIREKKFIYTSEEPLSEYELKKLFSDYIPVSPVDNCILMYEEYKWKKEHGYDDTQYPPKKQMI